MWGQIISAGAGILGSILGGNKQAKAQKQAIQAQERMAQQAMQLQREQMDRANALYQPYAAFGSQALSDLQNPNAFQASPDYAYRFGEGQRGVTSNRATMGMLNSGATLSALQRQGQNLASGEYGDWFNRTFSKANMGLGAVGQQANAGSMMANNIGNIYQGLGDAQGQSYVNRGDIAAQQLGNAFGGVSMLNGLWSNPFQKTNWATSMNNNVKPIGPNMTNAFRTPNFTYGA